MKLKEKVLELFDNLSIGCVGINNPNGADSVRCPSCAVYANISGYAICVEHITSLKHLDYCPLNNLYLSLKAGSS